MTEVFDLEGASEYLHIAGSTLYKYVRAGKIPGFKVGRIWRFKKEVLDDWMRAKTAEHTASATQKHKR